MYFVFFHAIVGGMSFGPFHSWEDADNYAEHCVSCNPCWSGMDVEVCEV
jgi:hypothetical protein